MTSKEACRTCGESLREHVYGAATECRWNPTADGSDLDPSYLLVKHQCWVGPNGEEYCRTCTADTPVDRVPWPCLPYRLAGSVVGWKVTAELWQEDSDRLHCEIQAVLKLHKPHPLDDSETDGWCYTCGDAMPCPTARALGAPDA